MTPSKGTSHDRQFFHGGNALSGRNPGTQSEPTSTTGTTGEASSAQQAASTAKEQAGEVGHQAAQNAKEVAGTAKEEATKVASEAKQQARQLYHETRSQLTEQAGAQQARLASGLRSASDELSEMVNNSEQQGVASELVSQLASRAGSVASWLDKRDPASVLDEVKRFARRRPGTFIAIAAAAGIVTGRLTRNLAAEAKESQEADNSHGPGTGMSGSGSGSVAPADVPPVPDASNSAPAPAAQSYTATGTIGSTTAPEASRI